MKLRGENACKASLKVEYSCEILLDNPIQKGELCDTAVTVSGLTWRYVFGADLDGGAVIPLNSLGRPYRNSENGKEDLEVTMHRGRGYKLEGNETHLSLTRQPDAVATGEY